MEGAQGLEIAKNAFPNFFGRKLLIFLNRAKNKFGKICKGQAAGIENKEIFLDRNGATRAIPVQS